MKLVYGINSRYLFPVCVSIWSVWKNASRPVDITIFEDGISPSDFDVLKRLENTCKGLGSINVVPFHLGQFKDYYKITTTKFPAIILLPLILPNQFNGRVVFIDADTLVLSDIWKLLETDLQEKPLGACTDIGHIDRFLKFISPKTIELFRFRNKNVIAWKRMRELERILTLGYIPGENYFNAGVLVMDCDRIRKMPNFKDLSSFEGLIPHLRFYPDQDRLNEFFANNWSQIHCKWNSPAKLKKYTRHGKDSVRFASDDFKQQIQEAYQNPMIWHFMGRKKPWNTKLVFNHSFKNWKEICQEFENKTGLNFRIQ